MNGKATPIEDTVQGHQADASSASVDAGERNKILLREHQHRAKNSLALVISLLQREQRIAASEQDARAADRLGTLMQRVMAIALAQDRLLSTDAGDTAHEAGTDLAGYLHDLLDSLEGSLSGRIAFETDLEPCMLSPDKAVAAGLIVNELVTNTAKHAYPEDEEGLVRVTLHADEARAEAALTVSDRGRGAAPAPSTKRRVGGGQGLKLLHLLARQLGGDVQQDTPARGTSVTLRFPVVVQRGLGRRPGSYAGA